MVKRLLPPAFQGLFFFNAGVVVFLTLADLVKRGRDSVVDIIFLELGCVILCRSEIERGDPGSRVVMERVIGLKKQERR